jgi:hypothetical protein
VTGELITAELKKGNPSERGRLAAFVNREWNALFQIRMALLHVCE